MKNLFTILIFSVLTTSASFGLAQNNGIAQNTTNGDVDCFEGSVIIMQGLKDDGMSALDALEIQEILYDACEDGVIGFNG